jgi:hypothetical protein
MTIATKLKASTSTAGLLLTMLGVLLPSCFALAIVGMTLTALAVGMDWLGAALESQWDGVGPREGLGASEEHQRSLSGRGERPGEVEVVAPFDASANCSSPTR